LDIFGDLTGVMVTADALLTQRKFAKSSKELIFGITSKHLSRPLLNRFWPPTVGIGSLKTAAITSLIPSMMKIEAKSERGMDRKT